MNVFDLGLPYVDINGNVIDYTSLIAQLEALSTDGITHNLTADSRYKNGVYVDQCQVFRWFMNNTNIASALSDYNTFIAGYTFTTNPYTYNWTVN